MRVLFVTNMWPEPERPWYGTFVNSQAQSLSDLGVDVDVFYVRGYRAQRNYFHGAARTLTWNRGLPYDLVHAHFGHTAALARLQVRNPLVISYCGDDLLGNPRLDGTLTPKSRMEVAVFRQLARVADATITKSLQMERRLPRACWDRNHVIPNGVNTSYFTPIPRDEARHALGWDLDAPSVLFAGNPENERKNYPLAAATVEIVRAAHPNVELNVAWGKSPDEVKLMMAASDVLLHTALLEGSPNVVKEAMAMELPVVVVRVGDVEERLAGISGCAVRPYEAEPLAQAVEAAIAHGRSPEARDAASRLSTATVGRRVLRVYEDVLGRPASGVTLDEVPHRPAARPSVPA